MSRMDADVWAPSRLTAHASSDEAAARRQARWAPVRWSHARWSHARWMLAMATGAATLLATGCSGEHHVFEGAGKGASSIGAIGLFMIITATVIGVFFLGLLAWALMHGGRSGTWRHERLVVIAGGVVLPVVVISILSVWTLGILDDRDGAAATTPGSEVIKVIGHQYWWEVRYPEAGVVTANEFAIPVGVPVEFTLVSDDVIHSFWVPSLAGKIDMVPGHTNHLKITATDPGEYRGQCAEFCGIQHANMAFIVHALPEPEYRAWLEHQAAPAAEPDTPSEAAGRAAFERLPCAACHEIRGAGIDPPREAQTYVVPAPDLTHLASRSIIGAGAAPNDTGHLGGWIVNSQTIKPGNEMPPIPMDPDVLRDLIQYLESLE